MRFSTITQNGKKLDNYDLEGLGSDLVHELASHGYMADFEINKQGKLKVGMRRKSFVINVARLGHNSRFNPLYNKPRRTSTPTWDQRVHYNNIINDYMDKYQLKAIIRNSVFIIRDKEGRKNESYWIDNEPEFSRHNTSRGYLIEKGFEAA